MLTRCVICQKRKARRECLRNDLQLICSLCCAEIRDGTCEGCKHYAQARDYQTTKAVTSGIPDGQFIVELNPEIEDAVDAALALAERGKVNEAWEAMTELSREHARNHMVCYGMGVVHIQKEELDEAVEWFKRAVAIFPPFVEAHFNLAAVFQQKLDLGNALRAYRRVVQHGNPDNEAVGHAQSFIDDMAAMIHETEGIDLDHYLASMDSFEAAFRLMEQEEWEQALSGFQVARDLNDRNASIHGNMALCYANLGQKARALAALDRALEIDPGYEPAQINRIGVEKMEEGVPQAAAVARIDYSLEKVREEKGRERPPMKKWPWQRK